MKKVVIPFDGNRFSKGAFSFANSLHEINPILLTGVFLPSIDYARFFFFPTVFSTPAYMPVMEDYEQEEVEANVDQFAQLCKKNFIEYRVHKDLYERSIPQLTKETRFADLMIIGSEIFKKGTTSGSNEYLTDALHNTECPVIIVSEKFNFPSHIILAYDGSASAVFAIKQFAYLFPELCNRKAILIYAGDEKHNIPNEALIEELVARHFEDLTVTKIISNNSNGFNNWIDQYKNSLIVSGSFGRSGVSELFNKSFVVNIIKKHTIPVFIAHI